MKNLNNKNANILIATISIVVVLVVALLLYKSQSNTNFDPRIYMLPKLNAFLNSSVTILLVMGLIFIKKRKINYHKASMLTAFIFSTLFLVSYILYHYNSVHTLFGDADGNGILSEVEKAKIAGIKSIYYIILLTHIALATIIVPLALFTLYRSFSGQFQKHKRIARITLPIWLYVSSTGVIVYFMISPYYPV